MTLQTCHCPDGSKEIKDVGRENNNTNQFNTITLKWPQKKREKKTHICTKQVTRVLNSCWKISKAHQVKQHIQTIGTSLHKLLSWEPSSHLLF